MYRGTRSTSCCCSASRSLLKVRPNRIAQHSCTAPHRTALHPPHHVAARAELPGLEVSRDGRSVTVGEVAAADGLEVCQAQVEVDYSYYSASAVLQVGSGVEWVGSRGVEGWGGAGGLCGRGAARLLYAAYAAGACCAGRQAGAMLACHNSGSIVGCYLMCICTCTDVQSRGCCLLRPHPHTSSSHTHTRMPLRSSQRILPPGSEVPSAFETVGHIAHLNLREELLPWKHVIGQVGGGGGGRR